MPTPCKCPETPNATAVSHRTYIAQTLRVQHPHRQPLLLLLLRCPATVLQRPDTAKSVSPRCRPACAPRPLFSSAKEIPIFQEELLRNASSVYVLLTQPPPSPKQAVPGETHMHAFALL